MIDPAAIGVEKLHELLGARLISPNRTRFCVWAPTHRTVSVVLETPDAPVPMTRLESGFHLVEIDGVPEGALYRFGFGDEDQTAFVCRPDPTSRFQPEGVHGPSMVIGDSFQWTDNEWRGVPRDELVIYELHVGAFTSKGSFRAAADRLDELVELGVNAIELMPVAASAGRWNWGYDGVNLFAPSQNYGTPDDLRFLVDSAHSKGVAVFLDVVYNHLGPEGNYLADCGPYLSPHHTTVWGAAPNFDRSDNAVTVRRIFAANAVHWLDDYHLDGLRVDAVHCMKDESDPHVVAEISRAVRSWASESGRSAMLIAESNVYDPNMIAPLDSGGMGFDAEWCDDFLHSVFAVARPGEQLCHRSYKTGDDLEQTLKYGYVYEGTLREERGRRRLTERVDTSRLVYSIQHHDFIGNHPLGKRLHQVTSIDFQRAASTLLFLTPAIPMIFMGEEFACDHPFRFFVDFGDDDLRNAVVEGRKREYPQHDWSGGILPIDPGAFLTSKIGDAAAGNTGMREWYRQLIEARKAWRSAGIITDDHMEATCDIDTGVYRIHYQSNTGCVSAIVRLSSVGRESGPIALSEQQSDSNLPEVIFNSRGDDVDAGSLWADHAVVLADSAAAAALREFSRKCHGVADPAQ